MKDYYELLEVSKNASEETIKKVFRMLIKNNHPDLFEGEEKLRAEEKVKDLNEAYEVLINKDSREKYDLQLEEYNNKIEDSLSILIEENEYLKNVINEKNNLIKRILEDEDVDFNILQNATTDNPYINQNQDGTIDNNYVQQNQNTNMTDGYNLYRREEMIKKIAISVIIVIVGIIILWITTGVNLFKILVNVFKAMF